MFKEDKKIPFIISLSFLLSFIAIRLAVLIAGSAESEFAAAAKAGNMPDAWFHIGSNIILFGYHIHHFYFGILLIAVAGWLAIVGTKHFSQKQVAIMYGVGLGLFLDEIGLLLTWGDYYSSLSYTISLFVLAMFLNIVFFSDFWKNFKGQIGKKSLTYKALKNKASFLSKVDSLILKVLKKEFLSKLFSAFLYLGIAVFIFLFPQFIHYYIAAILLILGAKYLLTNQLGEKENEI